MKTSLLLFGILAASTLSYASVAAPLTCVFLLQKWPGVTGGGNGGPRIRTARIVIPTLPTGPSDFAWNASTVLETSMEDGLDAGGDADGMPLRYPYQIAKLTCYLQNQISGPAYINCIDVTTQSLGSLLSPVLPFSVSLNAPYSKATLAEMSVLQEKEIFSVDGTCK